MVCAGGFRRAAETRQGPWFGALHVVGGAATPVTATSAAGGKLQDQAVARIDCVVLQVVPFPDLVGRDIMSPGNGPERITAADLVEGIHHGFAGIFDLEEQTAAGMDQIVPEIVPVFYFLR